MKATHYFVAVSLAFASFSSCQNEAAVDDSKRIETPAQLIANPSSESVTQVAFDEVNFAFGQIPKDIPVKHRFTFTNTGASDLVLESVKPTCQCTVTEYTKEAIKPGEKGFVDAEYNAKAVGTFKKSITVTANIDPRTVILGFEGEVVE